MVETVLVDVAEGALHDIGEAGETLVARAGGRTMFDSLVCMAAGAPQVAGSGIADDGSGPSTVVGTGRSAPHLSAAATNAIAAHVGDLDDLHWPSLTHPGSVIWPALLAVGQRDHVPLPVLRRAAAFGYQLVARASSLFGQAHRRTYHVSTTAGAIGVAGAVGWMLDRDLEAACTAMAHAASGIGGTAQAVREHARTAALHRGYAVAIGLIGAAHRRAHNPVRAPLTGEAGFFQATGIEPDLSTLSGAFEPAINEITHRQHAVNGFSHCLVDAALPLGPLAPERVNWAEFEIPSFAVALTESGEPENRTSAAWNLAYVAAAALTHRLAPDMFWPPAPSLDALRHRIKIIPRETEPPDLAVRGTVIIDGESRQVARSVPHGHPTDPLTDVELAAKAETLGVASKEGARQLLERLMVGTDPVPSELLSDLGLDTHRTAVSDGNGITPHRS